MNTLFEDKGSQGAPGYTTRGYNPVRLENFIDKENSVTLTRSELERLIRHDERLELITTLAAEGCLDESSLALLLSIDEPSVKNDITYQRKEVIR